MTPKCLLPTVYLSGAMEHVPDFGAGWREAIVPKLAQLGYTVINPSKLNELVMTDEEIKALPGWKKTEPEKYTTLVRALAGLDLRAACNSNVTLVKLDKAGAVSAGTHCEIAIAWYNQKHVVFWVDGVDMKDVPGFLHGIHHKLCFSEEEVLAHLRQFKDEVGT